MRDCYEDDDDDIGIYDQIDQIVNTEKDYDVDIKNVISYVFEEMGMGIENIKPHIKKYIEGVKSRGDNCEHYSVITYGKNTIVCVTCNCKWHCEECFNKISYGNFVWSHHSCCAYNCKHVINKKNTCYVCNKTYNYYEV